MNTIQRLYRRRIGEILVTQGVITSAQLDEAIAIQKRTGELLGSILLDIGAVTESDIARTLCVQYQLPFVTLANYDFDPKLVKLFPPEFLAKNKILPFDKVGDTLLVIIAEVPSEEVLAEIPKLTKMSAGLYVGYTSEVDTQLAKLVGVQTVKAAKGADPKGQDAGQSGVAARKPGSSSAAKAAAVQPPAPVAAIPEVTDSLGEPEEPPISADDRISSEVASLFDFGDQISLSLGEAISEDTVDAPKIQALPGKDAPRPSAPAAGSGGTPLALGEGTESFLEALNSTWDSIFPGAPKQGDGDADADDTE